MFLSPYNFTKDRAAVFCQKLLRGSAVVETGAAFQFLLP